MSEMLLNSAIDNDFICAKGYALPRKNIPFCTYIKAERAVPYEVGSVGKRNQIRQKLGMEISDGIVQFCETPKSRREIAEFIGETHHNTMLRYVNPLVKSDKLKYTISNCPQTSYQKFVNENGAGYIKSDEAVAEFCAVPRSACAIAKFVGIDKAVVYRNYINGLLESGRLKRTEPEGSSRQKYLNSEANPTEDTVFIADIRKEVSQKYAGRTFTVEEFATDFNVTMACAYRRIGRLYKRGWLNCEKVGKVQIYRITENGQKM
jgi:transposase